jgi:hypothetical protein
MRWALRAASAYVWCFSLISALEARRTVQRHAATARELLLLLQLLLLKLLRASQVTVSAKGPACPAPATFHACCAAASLHVWYCHRWFFQQLILAVDYCHRKGVANRDIKLENTLLQVC